MSDTPKFKGNCFGADINDRGRSDPVQMLHLYIEDDENWFHKCSINAFWLNEMIDVLKDAQKYLNSEKFKKTSFGEYVRKS